MTEVVTSSAAFQQLNLLAQRQQVFVVDRQSVDAGVITAETAPTAVETPEEPQQQFKSSDDTENPVNRHKDDAAPQARQEPVSGPSRPRIEIKHIDLGLTPSEVVGTPDVLQRFDSNGDGRVDLAEAARAGLAREGVFTFAGVGGATASDPAETPATEIPSADAADVASAVEAVQSLGIDPAAQKLGVSNASVIPKKHFVSAAAQGEASGVADAPKRFYGQGAEVVVGKFAVTETAPRFVEKGDAKTATVVSEDGTGEIRMYDKVAQTDTEQSGGDSAGGSAQEKTRQQLVAAYANAAAAHKKLAETIRAVTA